MDKSLKAILLLIAHQAPELFEPKNFNQLVNVCKMNGFWGKDDTIRRTLGSFKDKMSTTKSKMLEAEQSGLLSFSNSPKMKQNK